MTLYVGTSGWQYRDWRGRFYPPTLPQKAWLEHYAARFDTVEVNNSFYRLPPPEVFADWAARTPDGFVVVAKASRYLTHLKRLREPAEPVLRFMASAIRLGPKLGPVLLQLPPRFPAEPGRLDETLAAFPAGVRVAVEPRDPSWWTDEVRGVLERRDAALCWADRDERAVTPYWRTAGWGYVRFHEGRHPVRPGYREPALREWAERIAAAYGDAPVFAYFNNDPGGAAVRDAVTFAALARAAGLSPTRVPEVAEPAFF